MINTWRPGAESIYRNWLNFVAANKARRLTLPTVDAGLSVVPFVERRRANRVADARWQGRDRRLAASDSGAA